MFDYDFHAPIGAAGDLSPTHAELRRQHAFLAAFGERLADMPSTLPDVLPNGVDDVDTLRWAIRSDGASAWVFVDWQQPHVPLDTYRGARFAIGLDAGTVVFPHEPVDVPPGTIAHWPVHLELGGVRLRWVTASPLTVLGPPDRPTLVVVAEAGIPVELAVEGASVADAPGTVVATRQLAPGVFAVDAGDDEPRVVEVTQGDARLRVLVLPAASAAELWVLETPAGRRLVRSDAAVHLDDDGRLAVRSAARPRVLEFDAHAGAFVAVAVDAPDPGEDLVLAPRPTTVGEPPRRRTDSATAAPPRPTPRRSHGTATAWSVRLPDAAAGRRVLHVDWAGDVAVLELDGRVVADRFWDGTPWTIGLDAFELAPGAELTIRIVPLHPDAAVRLPADAEARRRAADGPLIALDRVRLVSSPIWRETQAGLRRVGRRVRRAARSRPGSRRAPRGRAPRRRAPRRPPHAW